MLRCCLQESSPHPSNVLELISPCQLHHQPVSFVCLAQECEFRSLLCNHCIEAHRDHKWMAVQSFFSQEMSDMILEGSSKMKSAFFETRMKTSNALEEATNAIHDRMIQENRKFNAVMAEMEDRHSIHWEVDVKQNRINNILMREICMLYEKEKKTAWVYQMSEYFSKVVKETENSLLNLIEDMGNYMKVKYWEEKPKQICEEAFIQFFNHLHKHIVPDLNYFKFCAATKHDGIKLNDNDLKANYVKSTPSSPVVVAGNCITREHSSFGIEVTRLNTKALFFPSTTIFIGVCIPQIVKTAGYRKINQASKGAFLIGSTGWSYHHSNPEFDRKECVGWGFGEEDKIEVVIDLDEPGAITFNKVGRFFGSSFRMPLDLTSKLLQQLKPCVSFDADQDSIVRIYEVG